MKLSNLIKKNTLCVEEKNYTVAFSVQNFYIRKSDIRNHILDENMVLSEHILNMLSAIKTI